jgi:hypothetical protein
MKCTDDYRDIALIRVSRSTVTCQQPPSIGIPFLLLHDWNVTTRDDYAIAYYMHKFAYEYARLIQ